jgi:hypothetical protein
MDVLFLLFSNYMILSYTNYVILSKLVGIPLHSSFNGCLLEFYRYHRFWLNWTGTLRVIVVTPQVDSLHPEWADLFNGKYTQQELINIRMLGRRIGYFVNDIRQPQQDLANSKRDRRKDTATQHLTPNHAIEASALADVLVGLHLYRCCQCRVVLIRPLLCAQCRSVIYCSKVAVEHSLVH